MQVNENSPNHGLLGLCQSVGMPTNAAVSRGGGIGGVRVLARETPDGCEGSGLATTDVGRRSEGAAPPFLREGTRTVGRWNFCGSNGLVFDEGGDAC